MELSEYDARHVRITDAEGKMHTGMAVYLPAEYCRHEYGKDEAGILVEDQLFLRSQIASIEEIEEHGTAELWTKRLILRRYRPEDAEVLHKCFGSDEAMYQYSGWNPYATLETSQEAVKGFIDSYRDEHFYGWVIESEDVLYGTVGAYDYKDDRIEVGFSIVRDCWGRGYATEALKAVLAYLTENEGISCVTAWCAAQNIGSRRVLEKAGMLLVGTETAGLMVGDRIYDKLIYEYKAVSA